MECNDLTLDERRALPVDAETISQLIDYRAETGASFEWTNYVHDMRAKLPDRGFDELQRWSNGVEDDAALAYVRKLWDEASNRPFNPRCDSLLIDLIRDSSEEWFEPSPRVAEMIAQAIANENAKQHERAAAAEQRWQAEADREHAEWLASGQPDWYEMYLRELPTKRKNAEAELPPIELFRQSFTVRHATDDEADKLDNIRNRPLDQWHRRYRYLWLKFAMKPISNLPSSYPAPSNSLPTDNAINLIAGNTAAATELGKPIVEGFIATQTNQLAANSPRIPDAAAAHPLFELLNVAIAKLFGNTSRTAQAVDMLAVLHLVHEQTFDTVRSQLRAAGAIFSDAKLQAAVQGFHARVAREVRSGAGWITDAKGVPDPQNSDNVGVFLNTIGVELRFNAWTNREEVQWGGAGFKPLQESDLNSLLTIASNSQHRFRPADGMFKRSLKTIAREATFDPVVDRLAAAEAAWDGLLRLDSWLARAIGVPNDAYMRAVGRNLIGGICKRVRRPGCKHDETIIFMGAEDTFKSTLCRIIAMDDSWFTDSVDFSGSPQNTIPQLFGRVVVELAELDGMAKREVTSIKRFLSAQSDNVTLKYEALTSDHARRCIFVGTSNETNPLRSDTGNRRFLPVEITKRIDIEFVRANIDQIFGEAATLETAGEPFMLPREVLPEARARQEAVRAEADFEVHLTAWFGRTSAPGFVIAAELASMLKDATGRSIPPSQYGNAMRRMGFVQIKPRLNGEQMRVWCRGRMEGGHHFSMRRMADGRRVPMLPILALPPVPITKAQTTN